MDTEEKTQALAFEEVFSAWFEDHKNGHSWAILMATDGEELGIVCECYTCGTQTRFGRLDPIQIIMAQKLLTAMTMGDIPGGPRGMASA